MDNDLREMHRLAVGEDGLRRLLNWLEQRFRGQTALLDHTGAPVPGVRTRTLDMSDEIADGVRRLTEGDKRSAAISAPGHHVRLVTVGGGPRSPILVLTGTPLTGPDDSSVLADALRLIDLRWRLDQAERHQARLRDAEIVIRESVLHLLMIGDLGGARRVGSALAPPLPDIVRVYLVEGPATEREEIALLCEDVLRGHAWVIRCPVYRRHLIVLVPTSESRDAADDMEPLLRRGDGHRNLVIGAGEAVRLRDVPTGYEQAFHALTAARHTTDRYLRFSREGDVASRLQPGGAQWAAALLDPLLRYLPARPQDPDAAELITTLRAWLDFRGGAVRQLKIHRNTLLARLRHVGELLGVCLDRVPTQAQLHLALRLLAGPRLPEPGSPTFPDRPLGFLELLDTPSVRSWSDSFLNGLLQPDNVTLRRTLEAWLTADAQLEPAATAIGVSAPGVRKRLVRVEQMLGRSLLGAPSARYDLFLALAIQERAALSL
ncbi:helix-turn-helix domain-containing protein [Pseudonocardia spinosispora]|uniref:helix-turn-helix domain-containing protein n=1 Tax=Pseudonocardia spinosispora TaxID=103441 RepID=UPI00048CD6DB|nr:helix-turn-helix domain-containing protein [Pseudonocardia spinosispora]